MTNGGQKVGSRGKGVWYFREGQKIELRRKGSGQNNMEDRRDEALKRGDEDKNNRGNRKQNREVERRRWARK